MKGRAILVLAASLLLGTVVAVVVYLNQREAPQEPEGRPERPLTAAERLREAADTMLRRWPQSPTIEELDRAYSHVEAATSANATDPRVLADAALVQVLRGDELRRRGGDRAVTQELFSAARKHFDRAIALDSALKDSHAAVHTTLFTFGAIPLEPGTVHVRVVDQAGAALKAAEVWVGSWYDHDFGPHGPPKRQTRRTDTLGVVVLPVDRGAGVQTLCARDADGEVGAVQIVDLAANVNSFTLTARPLVALSGEVTWVRPSGQPNQVALMVIQDGQRAGLGVIPGSTFTLRVPPCSVEVNVLAKEGWRLARKVTIRGDKPELRLEPISGPK